MTNERNGNVIEGNFTNWGYRVYWKDNQCIAMDKSGKWWPYNDCNGFELCPVCGFVGHPILTIKGNFY